MAEAHKRWNKTLRKAHTRDSLGALSKFAEIVDGRHRIVSRPPVIIPLRDLAASYEMTTRGGPEHSRGAVPRLQGYPQRQPPTTPGQIHDRRHGTQGGRRRQRRHPGVHGAPERPPQLRSPVPPVEGGHQVGPRGPPAQEPLRHCRPARGGRSAVDAGCLRHLPRLDQRSIRSQPVLLLAPATRHERHLRWSSACHRSA